MVMVNLGEIIKPMNESFIVAFLNWSGIKEEDFNDVPDSIKEYRKQCKGKDNVKDESVPLTNKGIKVIDDDLEE